MNIMLVSQCSKQALPATRRILDQFAERKSERTWLTPITQAGLQTLYQLLRKQARRNTAVACHWIKGGEIELLWVVGNRRKFNATGSVPTNFTRRDLFARSEEGWQFTESIALLAAIAGLFHDFGKATDLFQNKLKNARAPKSEVIRHEWLSVRLFEAFVAEDSDDAWLSKLAQPIEGLSKRLIDTAYCDTVAESRQTRKHVLLQGLVERPVAWAVGWLILAHHRLPVAPQDHPDVCAESAESWYAYLRPSWNSPQFASNVSNDDVKALWQFSHGLPCDSATWHKQAQSLSKRALRHTQLQQHNWCDNTFVLHLARCALMLADHHYSSLDERAKQYQPNKWRDKKTRTYANTKFSDKNRRTVHQKLDEHCIGVSHHSYLIAKAFARLSDLLPSVGDVRALNKPSAAPYTWQNKASELAKGAREVSRAQGGFFVNMASTGTGKTLANARIAYALSDARRGCRFNVLLGLRTLTLQTGAALRQRTGLSSTDLAVLVGSAAIRTLAEEAEKACEAKQETKKAPTYSGSESAQALLEEHDYLAYEGTLAQTRIGQWLQQKHGARGGQKLNTLISAPVLVSTIDHMMPASESARGGHQIAPILRLLSSDCVFDEPDDFNLSDQPALCRLVYFAGLLGSRVIFSSATLAPALMQALFCAYRAGREEYNQATLGRVAPIYCGWIDEFRTDKALINTDADFIAAHKVFVDKRLKHLSDVAPRNRAEIIPTKTAESPAQAQANMAPMLVEQACSLHQAHHLCLPDSDKTVSVGLIRMANIDPLVNVVRHVIEQDIPADTCLHICVYHARHLLYRRAYIEQHLDALLDRRDSQKFWENSDIHALRARTERHHLFLVFATAVAEVGRDHDYDWAIVEPSSMRSIIQLAGRVRRHRGPQTNHSANILLLEQNIRAQAGLSMCFVKPGYESAQNTLASHRLSEILAEHEYQSPSAASRISERATLTPNDRLVDLEHWATRQCLLGPNTQHFPAQLWWQAPVRWCYVLQQKTRFRAGRVQALYALVSEDLQSTPAMKKYDQGEWSRQDDLFERQNLTLNSGICMWPELSDQQMLQTLEEREGALEANCQRFASISVDESIGDTTRWKYHSWLGVFR